MQDARAHFVLVGGGLAGALLAAGLGQDGYRVDLFERRSDPGAGNFVGGRSINLALSARGIHALEQLGLADEVLADAIPMHGRMIHGRDGSLHRQPYDRDPSRHINSVGRAVLNRVTIAAARRLPNVNVHFNHRCVDVDTDRPAARFVREETGEAVEVAGDAVIGVDGAYSAVRRALQRQERFDYSQQYLAHGYKELTIPPGSGGEFLMERNALHIWPRRSFMMIALPNPDGSFTCTLFFPFEGPLSFAALRSPSDVESLFSREFPDAVPLMPTLLDDFFTNPTGSMVTVRCAPWHAGGRVALLGDAAHAIVPFFGQGANCAFEDCDELRRCLRERDSREQAFAEYQRRRRPNSEAIADLAIANFVEMRDKTAAPAFRAYKMLERRLHGWLPGVFVPLYTMISFTRIPYAQARARAKRQEQLLIVGTAALLLILLWIALLIVRCVWPAGG
ncbi:MAG: FAD-dependent monooxygenase [Phycisphaerales bacterium]|nr:FAD-dependent monooxygenase [Phycisphaerales bacterium]